MRSCHGPRLRQRCPRSSATARLGFPIRRSIIRTGSSSARDGGLYFCDVDNQRIRRFDFESRTTPTIAGDGQRAYSGDGGPATAGSLNMPHELVFDARGHMYIAERDSHVVRKVDGKTGMISTLAGTGVAGFSGDGGPAAQAQLRQPHSIDIGPDAGC